jgi:hypothetical protein
MSWVQFLIDLVMEPGASLKLLPVINVSIILLLIVLASSLWTSIDHIHIYAMTFLALGLLASVNWFVIEFKKIQASEKEKASESKSD